VRRLALAFIAATTALARAQSASFEVASIKPFQGLPLNVYMNTSGSRVTISGYGLPGLLMTAYQVEPWQIAGGPVWMETDRFNIIANAPGEGIPTEDQMREMLQTLLADRFQVKVHREKKESPVYALVVGKSGHKLKQSAGEGFSYTVGGRARTLEMTFSKATMEQLALQLSSSGGMGRVVLDKTALTGTYDFKLNWIPGDDTALTPDSDAASIFTAIQEQLGLRLEPQKAPVEILVIDHAEKPSAN
jgi:uncharacterized protein (TIGR03435 family)